MADLRPRLRARLAVCLSACALSFACVGSGSYTVRGRYAHPETPATPGPGPLLLSAQIQRYGDPPPALAETTEARMVEASEDQDDRLLLVFARQIDPVTVDARAFAIVRGDGRRVRPTRVFLAPGDEGDENRSLTLSGNFGDAEHPPVAVHVLGNLYAEDGEALTGLDAPILGPAEPDRVVLVERLASDARRCPGAAQVVRTYWSDALAEVGAEDLGSIELTLADGRSLTPSDFDDQARRVEDAPCAAPFTACLGPADDNVLDLCVSEESAVVHLRIPAGTFSDPSGTPTARVDLTLQD